MFNSIYLQELQQRTTDAISLQQEIEELTSKLQVPFDIHNVHTYVCDDLYLVHPRCVATIS